MVQVRAVLLFLCIAIVITCASLVQLDEQQALNLCPQDTPCLFFNSDIWVNNIAPVDGDDVSMLISNNTYGAPLVYIQLSVNNTFDLSLGNVKLSGAVGLLINNEGNLNLQMLSVDTFALVEIQDATVSSDDCAITEYARLVLSGEASFAPANFLVESESELKMLDSSNFQSTNATIGSVNVTEGCSFVVDTLTSPTSNDGEAASIFMTGYANIGNATLYRTFPEFGGTTIFESLAIYSASTVELTDNITVGDLFVDAQASVFIAGNATIGYISGQGSLIMFNVAATIGGANQINLQSMEISIEGISTISLTNALVNNIQTINTGVLLNDITLYLNQVSFGADLSIACSIFSNGLTILSNLQLDGPLVSAGPLAVMPGGSLNVSVFVQDGGASNLFGPVIASSISFMNSSVSASTTSLVGYVNMIHTSVHVSQSLSINGSVLFDSCKLNVPTFAIIGDVKCQGANFINGAFTSNSIFQTHGQITFVGSLTTSAYAHFNNTKLSFNNTQVQSPVVLADSSHVILDGPLFITGDFLLLSYQLNSPTPQPLVVNGSIYGSGTAYAPDFINITTNYFSHIGDHIIMQGNIVAPNMEMVTNITILGPTYLTGNVSIVNCSFNVNAPTVIQGILRMTSSDVFSQIGGQTLEVTEQIQSFDDATFASTVFTSTPNYTQFGRTFSPGSHFQASTILITKNCIMTTKVPAQINGNVITQGGILELRAPTNITGALSMDAASQLMIYNQQGASVSPNLYVNGTISVAGGLVYWLSPAPTKNVDYTIITYEKTMSGKFTTHDVYAPNDQLIQFKIRYGEKEVVLSYSKHKSANHVGMIVGIVVGVGGFLFIATFGVLYYFAKCRRTDYEAIVQ